MAEHRRPRNSGFVLNNQMLLILAGVLAAVLIVLLVISGSLLSPNTNQGDDSLNSVPGSSSTGTSEVTPPSSSIAPPTSSVPTSTAPSVPTPTLPVTPSGGEYVNVGSGYIVEVVQANVETFDGDTYDDYSHPTNNYLPEGTVDYCSKELLYGNGMKDVLLRSGHRV